MKLYTTVRYSFKSTYGFIFLALILYNMLSILLNVTRLGDSPVQSLLYKFWSTPILMYMSSVYSLCLVVICVCMYFNRRENLIYKVLNLAILSVFVVALWSYLTDVTFIYVVYILTFVSAVVMLFLSVVLMLPSSAVTVPKKKASSYIVFAFFVDIGNLFYASSFFATLILIYWIFAFYNNGPQHRSGSATLPIKIGGARKIALLVSKAWWSPFVVFPKFRQFAITFTKEPYFNISVDSNYRAGLKSFFIKLFTRVTGFIKLLKTFFNNVARALNSSTNTINTSMTSISSSVIETVAQTAATWSIFLTALPSDQFKTYAQNFSAAAVDARAGSSGLENLANIQYELYVGSPLLMLVCVIALLVGLIGAALLVSTKVLNFK